MCVCVCPDIKFLTKLIYDICCNVLQMLRTVPTCTRTRPMISLSCVMHAYEFTVSLETGCHHELTDCILLQL